MAIPLLVGADHHQRAALRRRRGAHRPRRHRSRLLATPSVASITHYEVLGVAHDGIDGGDPPRLPAGSPASTTRTTTPTSSGTMAAVNEAYRVLRHPGRRAVYDAELAARGRAPRAAPPTDVPAGQGATRARRRPRRRATRGSSSSAGAAVGGAVVLAAAALDRTERHRRARTTCSSRVRASSSRPTTTPARSRARAPPTTSSSSELVPLDGDCARSGCRPTATARAWATRASQRRGPVTT